MFLYYHQANFSGTQTLGGNGALGGLNTYGVNDRQDNFVPRLDLRAGLEHDVNDCLTVGLLYQFGAWFNVATVDNPDITLVSAEWLPDAAAKIADENFLTHSIMASAVLRR